MMKIIHLSLLAITHLMLKLSLSMAIFNIVCTDDNLWLLTSVPS